MPADVISLADRRAAAEPTGTRLRKRPSPAIVLTATQGAVTMLLGNQDDGAEVWLSPEEADSLGNDLKRFALAARGLRV